MTRSVDYYFTPQSPWTYLGHARFAALAKAAGATVRVRPIDFGAVFPVSGGLPLGKRAPQRQAYRLVDLARFSRHLDIPLNLKPQVLSRSPATMRPSSSSRSTCTTAPTRR